MLHASYALNIADVAIEEGFDPTKDFKIHAAVLGAEPCSEAMRSEIQEKLGVQVFDIYGLSEIMGPGVACECEMQHGFMSAKTNLLLK